MYVLIISRGYPTKKYKKNGIFEFDQAKALATAGCKVVYVALDVRSIRRWRKWGIECFKKDGVYVYAINIPGGRLPENILNVFRRIGLRILYKKIKREHGKPDLLHAHFIINFIAALAIKMQTGLPLIVTEHSSEINRPVIKKQLFKIASYAYKNVDAVIAVSPALANVIKDKFNVNSIFIPNVYNQDIFYFKPYKETDTFNFVSIGSLIYSKRMDLSIEAFYKAFRDNPVVRLTIFGEGEERRKLEGLISKYRLQNRVTLMGLCSREVIAEYLRKSDCFILASNAETFGVAYIEALAVGVPVIATRCGGPESFVNERNGIIIPVDELSNLVNAMLFMYNNINLFDREKISEEILKNFSSAAISQRLINLYEDIL